MIVINQNLPRVLVRVQPQTAQIAKDKAARDHHGVGKNVNVPRDQKATIQAVGSKKDALKEAN